MNELKKQMAGLYDRLEEIRVLAVKETRHLTADEIRERGELYAQIKSLAEQDDLRSELYGGSLSPGPLTLMPGEDLGGHRADQQLAPRGKRYRDLFGPSLDSDGWESRRAFFEAATSGKFHPNLRSLTIGSPSDGGFLVPTQYSAEIHDIALENEIVFPRCSVEPMSTDAKKIPATEIGSHANGLYGNMVAYWTSEGGDLTEKTPKFRQMTLVAQKLTILFKYSNEWKEDIQGGEAKLAGMAASGLGWFRDKALLKGTGAGQPLGILNANCTIEVAKETGQKADTILYTNLAKMVSRIHPACFSRSVWIVHVSTIPELLQLSITIGTAGTHVPVLNDASGQWRILTRPVVFTEKTAKLGDRGDIILADLSQYACGMRKDFRFETTNALGFTTDEMYGRMIIRLDGQPLWDKPLTLMDAQTTVSPFVVLGER